MNTTKKEDTIVSLENNAREKEPRSVGRGKTFGEFVYTFRRPMLVGFVLLIIVTLVISFYKVENSRPNQAAAAEIEEKYGIFTVVEDQVITVHFSKDGGAHVYQFPILLEGVTDVSQDYNIRHINSINSGGHTVALTLMVEPKKKE